jgi:hypothetical protein
MANDPKKWISPSAAVSLVQLVKKNEAAVKNNMYGEDGMRMRETAWNKITDEINSAFGLKITSIQLSKKFTNIKASVSSKIAQGRK